MVKPFAACPHRPMTLPTIAPPENSPAVLTPQDLGGQLSQVQNVKLGGHRKRISPTNRLWQRLLVWTLLRRLAGTTAPGHHDCSIQE
ncbi:hypothetical protein TNCV_4516411 [Trichonephila clavipes]|nr:hypothetical protein TNCV_4516411 [Trichonephila clavipes]